MVSMVWNIKLKYMALLLSLFLFTACTFDIGYLWSVSQGQLDLISRRVSIEKALKQYEFTEEEKKKLKLVSEIKAFARKKLEMDINDSIYSTYVQLNQPYVTYLLRVSSAYELKAHKWKFPIVGSVPYKGFFDKEEAKEAARSFPKEKYDVYLRGVRAYSTLGWMGDSVLSSMLAYREVDFVVMIFHELAHTVLFFKDHIDFNERFAEFIGRRATIQFYLDKEGEQSETVKKIREQWDDELLFSSFMAKEYGDLAKWYEENKGKVTPEIKQQRIKDIQDRFSKDIQPKLKTDKYYYFPELKLNNALLLSYRSYNYNIGEFDKLFSSSSVNSNVKAFIEESSQFKEEKDPEEALSRAVKNTESAL